MVTVALLFLRKLVAIQEDLEVSKSVFIGFILIPRVISRE